MNFSKYNEDILLYLNRTLSLHSEQKDELYRQTTHSNSSKTYRYFQIIEIFLLILILFEHTFVFILTFRKKTVQKHEKYLKKKKSKFYLIIFFFLCSFFRKENQRSVLLPVNSFLYSCLHRNWMRAFSFSNICLSLVYFVILILKHYHPNLVHYSSITFYSLPLNLLQQILINFSTFHLFIISISVFQYFLRYYRLLKNTYSSYFFDGQSLLLTKHTNVALILSGSLALIFGYNFIFYTPKYPQTISLLPLVTLNMILLPLINLLIFSFLIICFIINVFYKFNFEEISNDNEQENIRLIIEKNTCIKCYSKILEKNPNLFQDKNYSYKNLYQNFFSSRLNSSYPFQIKRNYFLSNKKARSQTDLSYEQDNSYETNHLFYQTTLNKLHRQHSLCHLCYNLLLIFLFKYIFLTFPQYLLQMLFHLRQFYQYIFKNNITANLTYSLYENNESLLIITHFLFLLSRFGDSFLLIRLPYLIKKYFPCWCHFNSKLLRKQQISHQILTTKTSDSSTNNEPTSPIDLPTTVHHLQQDNSLNNKHRRFRLKFQFIPIWSRNRPRLFKENI